MSMPQQLDPKKIALSVGFFVAVAHTLMVVFLLSGGLQLFQWTHFISFEYSVGQFVLLPFLIGVGIAFLIGAFFGLVFATIYNKVK